MRKYSRNIKKISLILIYLAIFLFTFYFFFIKEQNLSFVNVTVFIEEMLTLSISFWVLYEVTEIDIFNQGKIGRGLFYLFANFIIFSLRSMVIALGNLNIPVFYQLMRFFSSPEIFSLIRLVNTFLILIGLLYISSVYKLKE